MPALNQPFTNAHFRIQIDGLESTNAFEVVFPEARIADQPRTTQFGSLILRRGLTRSSEWYDWWNAARSAKAPRGRSVHIVLLDESGHDAIRWTYAAAQPIAYQMSSLHALGNEALIETLELRVGGFEASFAHASAPVSRRA